MPRKKKLMRLLLQSRLNHRLRRLCPQAAAPMASESFEKRLRMRLRFQLSPRHCGWVFHNRETLENVAAQTQEVLSAQELRSASQRLNPAQTTGLKRQP